MAEIVVRARDHHDNASKSNDRESDFKYNISLRSVWTLPSFEATGPWGHRYNPEGLIFVDGFEPRMAISLPLKMYRSFQEHSGCRAATTMYNSHIPASNLRYACLVCHEAASDGATKPREYFCRPKTDSAKKAEGIEVLLSYLCQCSPDSEHIVNTCLKFGDEDSAQRAQHILNHLIYLASGESWCKVLTLQPYLHGKMNVITSLDPEPGADGKVMKMPMFFILDEQTLAFYSQPFQVSPTYYMAFHKESKGRTVTSVQLVESSGEGRLEITAEHMHMILLPSSDDEESKLMLDRVYHLVTDVIQCKEKDIFTNKEGKKILDDYISCHPTWQRTVTDVLSWSLDSGTCADVKRHQWDIHYMDEYLASWSPDNWRSPEACTTSDAQPSCRSYFVRLPAANHAIAESYKDTHFNIRGLFCQPAVVSEDMQVMWAAAEADMLHFIDAGLVPASSIKSGGLNENSVDHFRHCVDEIQEALFSPRYDQALSHIRGLKQIFRESVNLELKEVAEMDELEIARCIFLGN